VSTAELIAKEIKDLEPREQSQVLEFLKLLKTREERDADPAFQRFSLASAMRGMENEPDLYSETLLGR
jgi:hypothetical protein